MERGAGIMWKQTRLIVVGILLLFTGTTVYAQSVSITNISPGLTAELTHGDKVTVRFDYSTRQASGVRIFIRPVTSGSLTPGYAASGSPVYSQGSGSGSAHFTIRDRDGNVSIDQLRVRMVTSNQNRLIFEFFLPVDLTYTSSSQNKIYPKVLNINPEARKALQNQLQKVEKAQARDTTDETGDSGIKKRVVRPDGTIEIHRSDGTVDVIEPSGILYTVYPSGDTLWAQKLYIEVQDNEEPASPPGVEASTAREANQEWVASLNAWVKHLGDQLLTRIQALLNDESSFRNYKDFEEKNTTTIYEKVNLRYRFLEKLLEYGS